MASNSAQHETATKALTINNETNDEKICNILRNETVDNVESIKLTKIIFTICLENIKINN